MPAVVFMPAGDLLAGSACARDGREPMLSRFGEGVTPANAWREYPRPQMVRGNWQSLNGLWQYAILPANADAKPSRFDGDILVPFGPQSLLSGVRRQVTEKEQIWYRRTFLTGAKSGERTLLHFESVDFRAQVFVNGVEATDVPHAGMNAPFELDVTGLVTAGENLLEVNVWDPACTHIGTTGKQMTDPYGSYHPGVSGIIGSVWLENVPATYLAGYRVDTDLRTKTATFRLDVRGNLRKATAEVVVSFGGRTLARGALDASRALDEPLAIALPEPLALWDCEHPNLYDVVIAVRDPAAGTCDETKGYFGLREVGKRRDAKGVWRFSLNGKPIYALGTLDHGWWPDGLLTPPSEAGLRYDVDYLKASGFNMIRKHIKVEPRAFYAYCDRVGMLVFQDMPCGGGDYDNRGKNNVPRWGLFRRELKDVVDHLRNHPSVAMWIPYNEGWGQPDAEKTRETFAWLRRYDPSRLLDGPSGWSDYQGGFITKRRAGQVPCDPPANPADVYSDAIDLHVYPGPAMHPVNETRVSFLGEFGSIGANLGAEHSWYDQPTGIRLREEKSGKPFSMVCEAGDWRGRIATRYTELTDRLVPLVRQGLGGSVYVLAVDTGIETDGLVTYDRRVEKFDRAFLRRQNARVQSAFAEVTRNVVVGCAARSSPRTD